jgi:PAS domain S-box-containing protein
VSGWASFFWTAFERSANPMALLQADRVLVAVNDAFVTTFRYRRDALVDRRADMLVVPEEWRRLEMEWSALLRNGRTMGERELVRADGRHVGVQYAAQREVVTGRQLILYVVCELHLRPLTHPGQRGGGTPSLTRREMQIIMEIAMGRRRGEIAAELHISPATVKTHVRNAMAKLGARSQAQLVAIALATGMLDGDAAGDH